MRATYLTAALFCIAFSAYGANSDCLQTGVSSGGDAVVKRLVSAPLPRVHEAVADAMQALGVFLFKNSDQSVEGERTPERITALGVGPGDEAVRAELTAFDEKGEAKTQVLVETLRGGNKKGAPKRTWSEAVADQTSCLVATLSLDDPLNRPVSSALGDTQFRIPDATQLAVRSRHFLFTTDAKLNRIIPFETAEDLLIDGSIVVPAGSLVAAFFDQVSDVKGFGRAAKGQLGFQYLVMPNGARVSLRGNVDLNGKSASKGALIAVGVLLGAASAGAVTGSGFAIPAGTLFHAEVNGEQHVRANERKPQGVSSR